MQLTKTILSIYTPTMEPDEFAKMIILVRNGTPHRFVFENWLQWCMTDSNPTPQFVYINFISSCLWKVWTFSCFGALYVSAWSRYGFKQVIPLGFFLFVYVIFCLPVHENYKTYIVWEQVVSADGTATDLKRESLGIIFASICLY